MSGSQKLIIPKPETETVRLGRFLDEEGMSQETVLRAVDLIQQRTEVFLDDALAVTEEISGFNSACKAGCGYCCHTLVSVAPPEAFYVARHVEMAFSPEERDAFKARVIEYAERTQGMDGGARYEGREACPFLRPDDWYCGLHKARPLVCRAMHSGSLPACMTAYRNRDSRFPAPTMAVFFKNTQAYISAYVSAFRARGVACYPLELSTALSIIWAEKDVFARWLAGEDVFKSAKVETVQQLRAPFAQRA